MTTPEERLESMGMTLPAPTKIPQGLHLPFSLVNIRGDRAVFSGHPKSSPDGGIAGPFGVVGSDLTTEQAYQEARDIGLSVLANLKAEIGDLGRITG